MFLDRLKRVGQAALEVLARVLAALWTMAVRNPRTTAYGAVGFLAVTLAPYGYDLTPEQQLRLAKFLIVVIGLVAGDQLNTRKRMKNR